MAEAHGPLAGLPPLTSTCVALIELPHQAKIDVRGRDATPALIAALTGAPRCRAAARRQSDDRRGGPHAALARPR
ncbi:MAG: hypothetical protein WDO24_25630 [Pseudomonadota bacterium]